MKTTIIYTKTESSSVEAVANGMAGYRVTFHVTEGDNIDTRIFIFQREVATNDDAAFTDTFYSVASVSQLESVPTAPTGDIPFYRASTVSLVFPNLADFRKYTDHLVALIDKLREANDIVINMLASETSATPDNTLARYWGLVSVGSVSDDDLAAKSVDYVFSQVADKTLANDAGPRYVYFAIRSDLPDVTVFKINTVDAPVVLDTRSVTNTNGYAHSYKIYRTTGTFAASTIVLATA